MQRATYYRYSICSGQLYLKATEKVHSNTLSCQEPDENTDTIQVWTLNIKPILGVWFTWETVKKQPCAVKGIVILLLLNHSGNTYVCEP